MVPFRALALCFSTDIDQRRIFGSSLKHFNAMKEILSASDTNRLVAELTFALRAEKEEKKKKKRLKRLQNAFKRPGIRRFLALFKAS